MKNTIYKFCILSILAALPVALFTGIYIWLDPFRIIHTYEPYFSDKDPMHVGWNKSFISTDNFNRHYEKEKYNSYIFGSSRSINYRAADWRRHLPSNASIYHFDASSETLTGILCKIKYIKSKGLDIENALIILDIELLPRKEDKENHLFIQHPELTPEHDFLKFHMAFFNVFRQRTFLKALYDLKLYDFQEEMVETGILTKHNPSYDPETNEERYPGIDSLIRFSSEQYYTPERLSQFPRNKEEILAPAYLEPGSKPFNILLQIKKELANDCDYYIIISPTIKLLRLNASDLRSLQQIFGTERVFDFSGKNKISEDYHSYYDDKSHSRPEICKILIDSIYSHQ